MAMKPLRLSTILIFLGVILLGFGIAYPLVTLVVDDTPPTIVFTLPANGETYPKVEAVWAQVEDSESGVKTVTCVIYDPAGTQIRSVELAKVATSTYYKGVIDTIDTPGDNYKAVFTAINNAGLTQTVTNYFNIYTELQGKWYIADQEVTETIQTVYVTNLTVPFKFVKTAGVADEYITCTVLEGGTTILTLTHTAPSTWEGSYTFTAGSHTLTIKASDMKKTISYSIVDLEIPGGVRITFTTQQMLMLAGIISIIAGVITRRKGG